MSSFLCRWFGINCPKPPVPPPNPLIDFSIGVSVRKDGTPDGIPTAVGTIGTDYQPFPDVQMASNDGGRMMFNVKGYPKDHLGWGGTLHLSAPDYVDASFRINMQNGSYDFNLSPKASWSINNVHPDGPLGPKEPNAPGFGDVSYDIPSELQIPDHPDLDFPRGDAFTFMTSWAPSEVNPTCDTDFLKSIGQNTNYGEKMWYTPLLPLYPDDVVERFLTDYSTLYTHLLIGRYGASTDRVKQVAEMAKRHGLFVFYHDYDITSILAMIPAVHGIVIGLEVDLHVNIGAGELDSITKSTCNAAIPAGVRVWMHFSSSGGPNHEQHWAFPVPGTSYTDWWIKLAGWGVSGLMYESYMDYEPDPSYTVDMGADPTFLGDCAGKMGAMLGYARRGLWAASQGLKVCACEIWSAPPFNGHTDGLFASRRCYEMVCCPSDGQMSPVCGYFGGARRPDGHVL